MDTPTLSGFHRELVDLLKRLRTEAGNPFYRYIATRSQVATFDATRKLCGDVLPKVRSSLHGAYSDSILGDGQR